MTLLTPDDFLSSVTVINPADLLTQGIRVVLIDIDNTLVPRDTQVLPNEVKAWVESLKECGLRICLLSNNWHDSVLAYAVELDVPIVHKSTKPFPFGYKHALKKVAHVKGEKVVMVGDQIFTDVLGARILGLNAILVAPQATKDLWYTLLLRRLERLIRGNVKPRE